MTKLTIDGPQGALATIRAGHGRPTPLVFLHADPGRASQWNSVTKLVASRHDTVAFDFRGAGSSEPARNGEYSIRARAGDLAAVVTAFGLSDFVIVAHSAAAAVALSYAADHDRIAGIVLVDPATDPRAMPEEVRNGFVRDMAGSDSADAFQSYVGSISGDDPAIRKQVLADAALVGTAARARLAEAFAAWNPEQALDAYHGDMVILSAPATDTAAALYHLRPGIRHQVIQTTGHWLQLDHPDIVAEVILDFVARIAQPDEAKPR